jgi:DNA-binding CsgD family transcriptional regulator
LTEGGIGARKKVIEGKPRPKPFHELLEATATLPPSLETAAFIRSILEILEDPNCYITIIQENWGLTDTEVVVLFVVVNCPGTPYKEIAPACGMSRDGLVFHLGNIYDKAGIPPGPDRRPALISKYLASRAGAAVFGINTSAALIDRLNEMSPADPYRPS